METRSRHFCKRCSAPGLEKTCFCINTFLPYKSGDKQGSSGKCTTLVYFSTGNVHAMSIAFTSPAKPITISSRKKNNLVITRGGSMTVATSKMERFIVIVKGWKLLTIITKRSMLDVVAVLNPPLITGSLRLAARKIS